MTPEQFNAIIDHIKTAVMVMTVVNVILFLALLLAMPKDRK